MGETCRGKSSSGWSSQSSPASLPSLTEAVENYERLLIDDEFSRQQGNIQRTADALRIARTTLHDKLKKYGLI